MDQLNICEKLIKSVMHIVAEEGIENTTTKKVAAGAGVNEVTLFRAFNTKDELLMQSFGCAEAELYRMFLRSLPTLQEESLSLDLRRQAFLHRCWIWLLEHPDLCRFYLRFYHSSYGASYSRAEHEADRKTIIQRLQNLLPQWDGRGEAEFLLVHLLDTMLGFAVKVISGQLPNNDETTSQIYDLLYHTLLSYQIDTKEPNCADDR